MPQLAPPQRASARYSINLAEAARCPSVPLLKSVTVVCILRQSLPIPMAPKFSANPATAPIRFDSESPWDKPCWSAAEMRSWKQSTGRESPSRSNPKHVARLPLPELLVHHSENRKIVHTRIQSPGKSRCHPSFHAGESIRHSDFERRRCTVCYSPSGADRTTRRPNHSAGSHGKGQRSLEINE